MLCESQLKSSPKALGGFEPEPDSLFSPSTGSAEIQDNQDTLESDSVLVHRGNKKTNKTLL